MPNSSQSEDLVAISKNKGWDPSRIWDQEKRAYTESIEAWDHPRDPFSPNLGDLPGEGAEILTAKGATDPTGGPVMSERVTWEMPDVSRESRENGKPKRTLSDPTAGDTTRDL